MDIYDLALLVEKTQEFHEAMFNREAFRCHTEEMGRIYKNKTDLFFCCHPDPARFYHFTLEECAEWACRRLNLDTRLARFIDLSMYWWNDVAEWAEDILKF
jgi:hypothetical protein